MKNNIFKMVLCALLMIVVPWTVSGNTISESESGFRWIKKINVSELRPHVNGLAAYCSVSGTWGFLDVFGSVVIPAEYEEVNDFEGDCARVKKDGKWGLIGRDGKVLVDFMLDEMSAFEEGLSCVTQGRKTYYIHPNGKSKHFSEKYEYYSFHEGLAKIKFGNKYGYMNAKGRIVVRPCYTEASDFSGGYALVMNKKAQKCINKKGRERELSRFLKEPLVFRDGFAKMKTIRGYQYVNKRLNLSIPAYKSAADYSEGLALVLKKDGRKAYINTKGKVAFYVPYEQSGDFHDGKAWFLTNGKYGYIDRTGKVIIAPVFSMVGDFGEGVVCVEYEGKKGLVKVSDGSEENYSELLLTSISLKDDDGDQAIHAGETFLLNVGVMNSGTQVLENIKLCLTYPQGKNYFRLLDSCQALPSLDARSESLITFHVMALPYLPTDMVSFEVEAQSYSLLSSVSRSFEAKTKGVKAKPIIAEVRVGNQGNTPLRAGEVNTLSVKVINKGVDSAHQVMLHFAWPEKVIFESTRQPLRSLAAGDSTFAEIKFIVDTSSVATKYAIAMSVSEYSGVAEDSCTLDFNMGKVNPIVNYVTGDTIEVKESKTGPTHIYIEEREIEGFVPDEQKQAHLPELLQGLDQANGKALNKYALIIGNRSYATDTVAFALESAKTFVEYCDKIFGVSSKQIVFLQDASATQIQAELNRLMKLCQARPNQIELIVYYTGKASYEEACHLTPVGKSAAATLKLNTLYKELSNAKAKKVTMFLDTDFCGHDSNTQSQLQKNIVVMTSNAHDQKAEAYPQKGQRMFSYFLMKELKETYGNVSLTELYRRVKDNMQTVSSQRPELLRSLDVQQGIERKRVY